MKRFCIKRWKVVWVFRGIKRTKYMYLNSNERTHVSILKAVQLMHVASFVQKGEIFVSSWNLKVTLCIEQIRMTWNAVFS